MDADTRYYRPYYASDSDEESAVSSDYLSDDSVRPPLPRPENAEEEPELPDFSEFARMLRAPVMYASGPTFETAEKEIKYGINEVTRDVVYGPILPEGTGTPLSIITKNVDNVIILESINRDFTVYPQPTVCQLLLPREYRSVSSFEIVEIGLNSTLFYFNASKYNIKIQSIEQDRLKYEYTLRPTESTPLVLTATIREGSYTIDNLLTEIQTQLNTPPLFFDYINGYTDFAELFQSTGDYSLNFNYPGDFYYDSLHSAFIPNPTRDTICSFYFQTRFATTESLGAYTIGQINVAYYYPVLKEYLIDPTTSSNEYANYLTDSDIKYILYNFQGLRDEKVISLTTDPANEPFKIILDTYRLKHTFRYSFVNQYSCTYNPTNNIVSIQTSRLNNSLVALINAQYNTILASDAAKYPAFNYTTVTESINTLHSILNGMYQLIQTTLVSMFGVAYGKYAIVYYTEFNNQVLLRSGMNIAGPIFNNNTFLPENISTNILTNYQVGPVSYWDNMMNIESFSFTSLNGGASNQPFYVNTLTYVINKPFIDPTGHIYTDYAEQSGDILVHIPAGKYAVFQFTSKYRQTMQVELLPKPTQLQYPEWNIANASYPNSSLFTIPYSNSIPFGNLLTIQNENNASPTLIDLTRLFLYTPNTLYVEGIDLNITTLLRNGVSYTFTAPRPPSVTSLTVLAKYRLFISILPGITVTTGSSTPYSISTVYSVGDTFVYDSTNYICIIVPISNPDDPSVSPYFTPIQRSAVFINSENGLSYNPGSLIQTFTDDCVIFVYHSQAAFFADTGPMGLLNENPLFYKYSYSIPAGSSILNFSFMVYEGETYYLLMRPLNDIFTNIPFRIIPYVTSTPIYELNTQLATSPSDPSYFDPTSPTFDYRAYMSTSFIVAKVHDPDWIQLPIDVPTNGTPDTEPINIAISTIRRALGYDINGVSNDITDYIPLVPGILNKRIDPINGYVYNITNTGSFITNPLNVRYTGDFSTAKLSYKIYNTNATAYLYTTGEVIPIISSYTSSITDGPLIGYNYDTKGNLLLGAGACGFTFLPTDGQWKVNTITFRGQTRRTAVQVLGVFPTWQVYQATPSTLISMLPKASAISVLTSSNIYPRTSLNGTYFTYSTIVNNTILRGAIQVPSVSASDTNSYYSVISFGGAARQVSTLSELVTALPSLQILPMENLAGSPIPYPYGYSTIKSGVFYDGISSINQSEMILAGVKSSSASAFIPNASLFYDKSVSVYERSMPVVNSHLHYLKTDTIRNNINALVPWLNYPVMPRNIIASVQGYLLLQGVTYAIVSISNGSPLFTSITTLSDDIIFPPSENTILLSITGNSTYYIFLGYNFVTNSLRIKTYNPKTNILTNVSYTLTQPYSPVTASIGDFVFSNTGSWWISYTITDRAYIYGVTDTGSEVTLQVGYGRAYLAMDTSSQRVYYASGTNGFSSISQFLTTTGPSLTDINTSLVGYKVTRFVQMATYGSLVYLIDSVQSGFFSWSPLTRDVYLSPKYFNSVPINIAIGPVNSLWICFGVAPYIMGHGFDINVVDLAWQIFFPAIKVNLQMVAPSYTSITNRSTLTSEWQHSSLFVYSTFNSFSKDILENGGQWGMESNYMVSDARLRGYDYNGYIQNIPVVPNWSPTPLTSNSPNAYYLAIRGFSPTEDYYGILRWKVPNRTDFGYMPISTIMNEISTFTHVSTNYNLTYLTAISTFDKVFTGINTYGLSIASGIPGSTIQTYGFSDFLQKYSTIYNLYNGYQNYLANVNTSVTQQMSNYLLSNLQYIIPSTFLSRMGYTDPIPFSLQWATLTAQSPVTIANDVSQWGVGWNLGYSKTDTPYAILHNAESLFKIQDEYIYLRLNPEFNINRLDTGSKENYADTREPSGITDQYYCKLLLNGFGNKATTFTHNPVTFNPKLPRLSKMNFEWVDARGNVLTTNSSTNSEWNMTIHIQEQIRTFDFTSVEIETAMSSLRAVSTSIRSE
jgi:hypothetical protein